MLAQVRHARVRLVTVAGMVEPEELKSIPVVANRPDPKTVHFAMRAQVEQLRFVAKIGFVIQISTG